MKKMMLLLTLDEKAEWMKHVLPSFSKNKFKYLQSQEVRERMDNAIIEVKE